METTMTMDRKPVAGLLLARNPVARKMPRTREEFRLAAIWLARKAAVVGDEACKWLWPPSDPEMGIKRGYLDSRDGRI